MQLLLRSLAIVAATIAVPLGLASAMNGASFVDVAARSLSWFSVAIALWSVAVVRQRIEDRAGG